MLTSNKVQAPSGLALALVKAKPKKPLTPPAAPTTTAPTAPAATAPPVDPIIGQAQGQINPVLDAITKGIQARAAGAAKAIQGLTDTYASRAAQYAPQVAGVYDRAKQEQRAADASLAQQQRASGDEISAALAGRLDQLDAPNAVAAATDPVLARAQGAAGATAATGSASLSRLIGDSAAEQAYGLKVPGFVNQTGLQAIGQNEAQAQNDINSATVELQKQLPSIISQLRQEQQQKQAADAAAAAASAKVDPTLSAAAGRLVNQYGETIPGKDGKPVPYTPYEKPSSSKPTILKGPDGYYTVGPDGKAQPLGLGLPPASSGSTHLQSKTVNGHTVTFDPTTGTYYIPGTTTPVDPNSFKKPAPKPTADQMNSARSYLTQQSKGFYASQADPSTPLKASDIATAAKNANGGVGMSVSDFLANTPEGAAARAAAGIGWNQVVGGKENWPEIQQLYLTLVKQYGIPARQAFQMVAGTYKVWGKAHKGSYFPKAEAAQGAAGTAAYTGKWVAPRSGVDIADVDKKLLAAVDSLGSYLGKKITIESGYRDVAKQAALYRRYVQSGYNNAYIAAKPGESNHNRGEALDLTIDGVPISKAVPASVLARFGLHNPVKGDLPHTTLIGVNG